MKSNNISLPPAAAMRTLFNVLETQNIIECKANITLQNARTAQILVSHCHS